MRIAAEGHLTTEALMWNQNNQTTISLSFKLLVSYLVVSYSVRRHLIHLPPIFPSYEQQPGYI